MYDYFFEDAKLKEILDLPGFSILNYLSRDMLCNF